MPYNGWQRIHTKMNKKWSLCLKMFLAEYEYKLILLLYSSFPKWSPHTRKLQYAVKKSLRGCKPVKDHRVYTSLAGGHPPAPICCPILGHLPWFFVHVAGNEVSTMIVKRKYMDPIFIPQICTYFKSICSFSDFS